MSAHDTQRLRDFLMSCKEDLLTVKALAAGTRLQMFEVQKLLRYIRPAWPNTSEFYSRKDLQKAFSPETPIDENLEVFASDEPVPPPGCKCVLEGRKP